MKKIIKMIVEIESDDDFNLDELAVGKYVEDSTAGEESVLLTEGELGEETFFRVKEYHKVEDVTEKVKTQREQLIAIGHLNNTIISDNDYEKIYSNELDEEEQKEIEVAKFENI